jgi:hypothetical protein
MQDTGSGLQLISLTGSVNSSVNIPVFTPGTTAPVTVTATKVDQNLSSDVAFRASNMAGLTTSCDPVDFTATLDGITEQHVFRGLPASEHYIRIVNGMPGVRQMQFNVNGQWFPVPGLKSGGTYVVNIGAAMLPDNYKNRRMTGIMLSCTPPARAALRLTF